MDFPLTYADAITVIIVAFITTFAVKRSQHSSMQKVLETVRRAGEGNLDVRVDLNRRDMVGELAGELDILLARRASEASELLGIGEEYDRYRANTQLWLKTGLRLVSLSEFDVVVRESASSILRLSGAEDFFLYLHPPLSGINVIYQMSAVDGQVRQFKKYQTDLCVNKAMTEAKSIYFENVEHDDNFDQTTKEEAGIKVKSTLATPLIRNGEVVGAIQLVNKPDRFDPYDIERLEFLSGFVVAALGRTGESLMNR